MANQPPFFSSPAVSLVGTTANPAASQSPDGSPAVAGFGRNGDLLMSSVHGPWGLMTARKQTFYSTVTTAAVAIPVNTTTSGSTFCLVNPVGSGVFMELIDFKLDFLHTNAAPATANVIGLSFVDAATNAISSITKAPVPLGGTTGALCGNVGAAVGQGYVATAITFASALTIAANWGYSLYSFPASWVPTVGGYPVPMIHEFKGKIILPPGKCATLVASTAWGATTTVPSVSWAEYLV